MLLVYVISPFVRYRSGVSGSAGTLDFPWTGLQEFRDSKYTILNLDPIIYGY